MNFHKILIQLLDIYNCLEFKYIDHIFFSFNESVEVIRKVSDYFKYMGNNVPHYLYALKVFDDDRY